MKYIVYITINLCNGKFYIGVHKTNPDTFDGYIGCGIYRQNQATKNYPFHNAVRKYGYNNFKRTTIEVFDTQEEAYQLESLIITRTLLHSKQCYNIQNGGLGSTGFTRKAVYQFALNGNFIKKWTSVKEASETLNISYIDTVCRGERDSAGGFYWSYTKEFKYIPYNSRKTIAQYTPSGKFIRTWDSEKEAQLELCINNIHTAIKLEHLCGGYMWKHFNGSTENINPYIDKRKLSKIFNNIQQLDANNNVIKVWDNLQDMEASGFKIQYVRNVIKGRQKTYKGYIFKIQDKDIVSSSDENQSSSTKNISTVTTQVEDI